MLKNNIEAGNYSNSIIGSNNNINMNLNNEVPRSVLYSICLDISKIDIDTSTEFSISKNADWENKINYNNLQIFQGIFEDYCGGYFGVEEVLEGDTQSEIMVLKVKNLFKHICINNHNNSNDQKLFELYTKIQKKIEHHYSINDGNITEEQFDKAVYQIMFYVFVKCQILEIPK